MSNIKIFSDSTCDLSPEDIKQMDIGIVPLSIVFNNDVYKEGIDINTKQLFKMVKAQKVLPKTSAPSPAEFVEHFKPFVDEGKTIIYISLSSKVSSTYNNACTAAEMLGNDKVKVIDSLDFCCTLGGLVKYCYNFCQSDMAVDDIVNEITKIKDNYKLFFTVEALDYLHMGGRCSATQLIFGNTLNIKPIILMSKDGMDVWRKTLGKKKAINLMIEEAVRDKDKIRYNEIHIGCSVGNEGELNWLKKQLIKETGITKYHEYEIGCVISSHCGEGTVGLGYFLEE